MYLKSLEIHGFKSFSDKTILNFLPSKNGRNSVTAIVGPNGSGKSNVADAIRWVMGEQSMKMLRGKKGEDIIFAGAEGRGKMGAASVVMILDNHDHRIQLDYDEIVVSRRMDRSGESEYLINGNVVRLFDLQVLLAQAQFGHGSYSVIGQGMIDRLLLQTPAERKDFFDEACGIKEFQIKRHQASLKLERTRVHMDEAEMLLNEIRPRMKTLSRQVKKLEERQDIKISLRGKQEQYYVTVWGAQKASLDELRVNTAILKEQLSNEQLALDKVQTSLADLAKETSRSAVFYGLQQDYAKILDQKKQFEREYAQLSAKLQTSYSSSGQQDLGWLIKKRENAQALRERFDHEAQTASFAFKQAKKDLEDAEKIFVDTENRLKNERDNIRILEEAVSRIKNESLTISRHEVRALDYILRDPMRYGTVYGTVADLADVAPEYALALDVATGAHGSSIIVESDVVAERWINYLRNERMGIATFLPLNTVKPRVLPSDSAQFLSRPGVHGLAKDLLVYDKKFEVVFSFLYGGTLIVESIDIARSVGIGRIRMVTMSGDIVETSGAMKGGWRERKNFTTGFSGGRRATRELEEKERKLENAKLAIPALETDNQQSATNVREAARIFEAAKNHTESVNARLKEVEVEYKNLDEEYRLHTADRIEQGNILGDIRNRTNELEKTLASLEIELKDSQTKLDKFQSDEEEKKRKIFSLQDEMQSIQQVVNIKLEEKNAKEIEIARLETKQEDIAREVQIELGESIDNVVSRGASAVITEQIPTVLSDIQKLKYSLSLIGGIDEEVVKEYEETKIRHDGLDSQLNDLRKAFDDLQALIAELDSIMTKKRSETFKHIRKEFSRYFEVLFGGGKADVVEVKGEVGEVVNEEDGSNTQEDQVTSPQNKKTEVFGIDVIANPPGKKINNIQALSGGERTMTSLALLSAILHTNPAPFVVLDEVEAALDEANTVRFGGILQELAVKSQFIIITHNRATMHIADALYGVTMGGEGVSRLVGVKVES